MKMRYESKLVNRAGRDWQPLVDGAPGFRAMLAAEIRVLDERAGLVEYVASDETIDSYLEIIRVDGWLFDYLQKNFPFVDTHDYSTIAKLLGTGVDWRIDKRKRRLIETVRWAKDVKENQLAQLGWNMLMAGFGPKAVSVGFRPVNYVTKWDNDRKPWLEQLQDLGIHEESGVRAIYIEQQQIELSACILGANPNALQLAAKAYKAGAIGDTDLEFISRELASRETLSPADDPAEAGEKRRQEQMRFLDKLQATIKTQ